jgi:hypothetical protein
MAKTDTTTLPPLAMQSPSSSIPRHTTSTRSSRKPKASPWWAASSCNDRDAELIGGGSASWGERGKRRVQRAAGFQVVVVVIVSRGGHALSRVSGGDGWMAEAMVVGLECLQAPRRHVQMAWHLHDPCCGLMQAVTCACVTPHQNPS